jgi:3-hydroxyacyl-CoA dehydrogenase
MKKLNVRKVAVLGSGVMGASIAAHCANAGIPVLLLDVVPEDAGPRERNRLAAGAVRALGKTRPAPLFTRDVAGRIEVGNLVDDLGRLAEVDWVIEAVRETLEVKRTVLAAAARHVRPDALLTTNTSGLPLNELERALPPEARRSFAGVHFFNPPRYMRLVELIPGPSTAPDVLDGLEELCTTRLGKGVVRAKDTPNFVANRIGIHALMAALEAMRELGLTIEEVDAITGPPLGRPKTGTFRLADLVGVDVVALVAHNVRDLARDESAAMFAVPAYVERMIERGLLGQKTGSGFYHKPRDGRGAVRTLDLETLEYRDARPPDLPDLARVQRIEDPAERLRALVAGEGRASLAAWRVLAPTLAYSARRVGEIADDVETIDRAMRLGYNWALGPFEAWDALGFRETAARLREDGHALPGWVEDRLARGATSLYEADGRREDTRAVRLAALRRAGAEVRGNRSASLVDLGEGVLGLEFHSKLNALDRDSIEMMLAAPDEAAARFGALVVANDGEGFCAGANLKMLLELVVARDFRGIEELVRSFQRATDALERCAVPVVVAPHGLALGGGCEIVLAGAAIRAAAESYIGLAEAGVGLLPAGGGCLRLYKRNLARLGSAPDAFPAFKETFETIALARVSGSAAEARELGFLRPGDAWSMNPDHRVRDARDLALALASGGYAPPPPERALPALGEGGMAWVEAALANLAEGNFASEHDCKIGREIGRVLSGGAVAGPTAVSEQHLLDLEVEGFLRLCGEPKTHARIQAMLETGKPLRN